MYGAKGACAGSVSPDCGKRREDCMCVNTDLKSRHVQSGESGGTVSPVGTGTCSLKES